MADRQTFSGRLRRITQEVIGVAPTHETGWDLSGVLDDQIRMGYIVVERGKALHGTSGAVLSGTPIRHPIKNLSSPLYLLVVRCLIGFTAFALFGDLLMALVVSYPTHLQDRLFDTFDLVVKVGLGGLGGVITGKAIPPPKDDDADE